MGNELYVAEGDLLTVAFIEIVLQSLSHAVYFW